jgi:hypothetical protein
VTSGSNRGVHHHLTCVPVAHTSFVCRRLAPLARTVAAFSGGSLITFFQAQRDLQSTLAAGTATARLPAQAAA